MNEDSEIDLEIFIQLVTLTELFLGGRGLKRAFGKNIEVCNQCVVFRSIASIEDPVLTTKRLSHLNKK